MGIPGTVTIEDVHALATSAAFPEVYVEIYGERSISKIVNEVKYDGSLVAKSNKDLKNTHIIK